MASFSTTAFALMLASERVVHMAKITISYRRSMDITGRIFDRLTSRYRSRDHATSTAFRQDWIFANTFSQALRTATC
jgi:hypothetical protein